MEVQLFFMKKKIIFFISLLVSIHLFSQGTDQAAIKKILSTQTDAWNRGDIDGFMQGYWQNDSLMFIGKSGVTYGWKNTLANYKKNYPDTAAMGKLTFTLISLKQLSSDYFHVVGKWYLQRSVGDIGGHFTLLFRKIKNRWFIIADHSN